MIDFPRSLRFSGTTFHYTRDPQGFAAPDIVTALGPTNESIYVVVGTLIDSSSVDGASPRHINVGAFPFAAAVPGSQRGRALRVQHTEQVLVERGPGQLHLGNQRILQLQR